MSAHADAHRHSRTDARKQYVRQHNQQFARFGKRGAGGPAVQQSTGARSPVSTAQILGFEFPTQARLPNSKPTRSTSFTTSIPAPLSVFGRGKWFEPSSRHAPLAGTFQLYASRCAAPDSPFILNNRWPRFGRAVQRAPQLSVPPHVRPFVGDSRPLSFHPPPRCPSVREALAGEGLRVLHARWQTGRRRPSSALCRAPLRYGTGRGNRTSCRPDDPCSLQRPSKESRKKKPQKSAAKPRILHTFCCTDL